MSREIKFRAWRLDGEMYKPFDLTNLVSDEYAGESWLDCGDGLQIDHRTGWDSLKIMQYTGLKDKNGKEIYEGDIVRVNDDQDGDRTYEIIFKEGCYWGNCIYTPKPSTTPQKTLLCDLDYFDNQSKEIIGNIYENPELITGVKNG